MTLDRRQLLFAGGAWLASCRSAASHAPPHTETLLAAHAAVWPEKGGGANHFPMAADVLDAWQRNDAIPAAWLAAAATYGGPPPREEPPLWRRFAAQRDEQRERFARSDWRTTLATQLPALVPGCVGALWHGMIRTAHAARSLARVDSPARRDELATAVAYWQVRQVELTPNVAPSGPADRLVPWLQHLHHGTAPEAADVAFADVTSRLQAAATIPPAIPAPEAPVVTLLALARGAATVLHAMLRLQRHRIWHLHAVTAPAAALLLLPHLDAVPARQLAAVLHQGVVALFSAFGAPFDVPPDDGRALPTWPELTEAAVASGSVHTLKLIDALQRCRDDTHDRALRAVARQWLAWR